MATARTTRRIRQFQVALYLFAGLILVDQVSQLMVGILPIHPGRVNWRYASFTLAVGYTATLLLADLLVIAAATGLGHRAFLRAWSVLHSLVALAVAAVIPLFLLDGLEMRARVQAEFRAAILATSARVAIVAGLAVVACIFAAVLLWRWSRKSADEPSAPLITDLSEGRRARS